MKVLLPENVEKCKLILDKKDKKILSLLCYNVRLPLQKIASIVSLSRNSVDYRIRMMKERNLIIGTRAVINIRKLNHQSYHFFVNFNEELNDKVFIDRCNKHDNVAALISYSGSWNFEVAIMAKNDESARNIFRELVKDLDVGDFEVCILLSTLKSSVLPSYDSNYEIKHLKKDPSFSKYFKLPEKEHIPDSKDMKVMKMLAMSAQQSLSEIGKKVSLTKDAVRYRIRNLIQAKQIMQFRPVINFDALNLSIKSILIKSDPSVDDEEFKSYLKVRNNILWATETFGDYSHIIYVITEKDEELHEVINDMTKKFRKLIKNYEVLFAYKEYKYSFMPDAIQ